jgi:AcrR family transcriptional regulator
VAPHSRVTSSTAYRSPAVGEPEGRRARPRREDVRAAILAAADTEFREHGFHAATVERIAARAGFTKGAVYSNFEGKFELFLALQDAESSSRGALLSGLGAPPDTPDEAVRQVAAGMVQLMTHAMLPTMLLAEVRAYASRSPELAARFADSRTALVQLITAQVEGAAERIGMRLVVPSTEATYAILALLNGIPLEQVGLAEPVVSTETLYRLLRSLMEPVQPT